MHLLLLFFVLWMGGVSLAIGRPVNLDAPSGTLGAASAFGYVEEWREIQDVDFGNGVALPLRLEFSSEPGQQSAYLGHGWWVPLLEAKAVMIDEKTMRTELLCGKVLYLHRTPAAGQFATLSGEWKGAQDSAADNFTVWRDDGWLLRYHKSHLVELKTDQGRDIQWKYDGDNLVSLEERGGSALTVERDGAGTPTAFVVNGQRYSFTLGRRPLVQKVNGQILVSELAATLSNWRWPNGSSDTFNYSLTPGRDPLWETTDAGGQKSRYTWDANGHILSGNDWTYQVGPRVPKSNLPEISRTNAQGQSESIRIATVTGEIIERNLQGMETRTVLFRNPGPFFNKVREITETAADGMTRVIAKRSYDETGRLIRSLDEGSTITAYAYDKAGQLVSQTTSIDPRALASLQQKEAAMLRAIAEAKDPGRKNDLTIALGAFYIHDMKEYAKALQLAEACPDRCNGYTVCFEAIFYNNKLTSQEKIAEYRQLLPLYPEYTAGINGLIQAIQSQLVEK